MKIEGGKIECRIRSIHHDVNRGGQICGILLTQGLPGQGVFWHVEIMVDASNGASDYGNYTVLSICLSFCVCVYLPVYLCVYLSVCLRVM